MLGKDMDEQFGQLGGGDSIVSRTKESLLTKIAVKPSESGSCLIKSIAINSQGQNGIGSCQRRPCSLCCFAFDLAQVVQD
jgi:hypothetical protein